jgi:hypothetical protein
MRTSRITCAGVDRPGQPMAVIDITPKLHKIFIKMMKTIEIQEQKRIMLLNQEFTLGEVLI